MTSDIRLLAIDLQQDVDSDVYACEIIKKIQGTSPEQLNSVCNELIDGRTLGQALVAKDKAPVIKYILECGVKLKDIDQSLLHIALSHRCKRVVSLLSEQGYDLCQRGADGKTPLHVAAEVDGCADMLREILKTGGNAGINLQELTGCTALTLAAMNDNEESASILIEHEASLDVDGPYSPLHTAAFLGNITMVQLLLDSGASVDYTDVNGETALHYAAYRGHKSVIHELLKRGSKTDIVDLQGKTPLDLSKNDQISMLLQDHLTKL